MLSVLGLPSFSFLSKNNHMLGYVLDRVAVRWGRDGDCGALPWVDGCRLLT